MSSFLISSFRYFFPFSSPLLSRLFSPPTDLLFWILPLCCPSLVSLCYISLPFTFLSVFFHAVDYSGTKPYFIAWLKWRHGFLFSEKLQSGWFSLSSSTSHLFIFSRFSSSPPPLPLSCLSSVFPSTLFSFSHLLHSSSFTFCFSSSQNHIYLSCNFQYFNFFPFKYLILSLCLPRLPPYLLCLLSFFLHF